MAKLILIPTPIGNLEDITYRAIRMLAEVDLILAEDTRTTGVLLKHYSITTRMRSYHKFNEHKSTAAVIEQIKSGLRIALVSDAGTPAISDPGYLLVRACREAEIDVECLPGATALIPALAASGLPSDRFCFEGFLPVKKGRRTRLDVLATESRTIVFYESPHRIAKTLTQLSEVMGQQRPAVLCRELSKMFEEYIYGTLGELSQTSQTRKFKGEMVLVVGGMPGKSHNRVKKDRD